MQRHWMAMILAGLATAGMAVGCDNPKVASLHADGGGAQGGAAGSAGSSGSAGTAGNAGSAGTDGGAGTDAGGSGGAGGSDAGDAGPTPGANPVGVVVVPGTQADGGTGTAHLLVAGTDFSTTTEIASIDLATKTVTGHLTVSDGDAVPAASGGMGFVLERTNAKVDVLAQDGTLANSIDVSATGTGSADSGGATRAYVPLYDGNRVAVLDLSTGTVSHSLDLSGYLDAADGDGSVDADNAVYDAASGRLYLTLQRIDRTTIAPPDYELACPPVPGLLVAFDTATDTEVDLNGSAPGNAIALSTVNPVSADLDQGKLVILSAGCFDKSDAGAPRQGHGIESIDLSTGQSTLLYQPTNDDFLAELLPVGAGKALIDRFDASFAEHWNQYSIGAGALGTELSAVPTGVTFDGSNGLYGIATTSGEGGTSIDVVHYDLSAETATTLLSSPWQSSVTNAAGSALVQ